MITAGPLQRPSAGSHPKICPSCGAGIRYKYVLTAKAETYVGKCDPCGFTIRVKGGADQ